MKVSDLLNISANEIQVLNPKYQGRYRCTDDYMEMFAYLTASEALNLCDNLSEIPLGHRSRTSAVNYYSNLNEQRKHNDLQEAQRNKRH